MSNFAEAASRVCRRCTNAARPSRRIASVKASQCTVEKNISRVVEEMSDKDLQQIENQIMPHRREMEARRPFGAMVTSNKGVFRDYKCAKGSLNLMRELRLLYWVATPHNHVLG